MSLLLSSIPEAAADTASIDRRAGELVDRRAQRAHQRADWMFAGLLLGQWTAAVGVALGSSEAFQAPGWVAVVGGLALNGLPLALVALRPGRFETRLAIAAAQMGWSAIFARGFAGGVEAHLYLIGSLAFLAWYRDWRVVVAGAAFAAIAHPLGQGVLPESVLGVVDREGWRFPQHLGWIAVEAVVLVGVCRRGAAELGQISRHQAQVEALTRSAERRSRELDLALTRLRGAQEAWGRSEKLAAVGRLAAGVGHDLKSPLAALHDAHRYLVRRISRGGELSGDARVTLFTGIIEGELEACDRILAELLEFAEDRPPLLAPCPLGDLVDDALAVVALPGVTRVINDISEELPVPAVDAGQFRQVIVHLVRNAVEAVRDANGSGRVIVGASGGGALAWRITVSDNGAGIEPEALTQIFDPLYTTKAKRSGLGLAIVSTLVHRHHGEVSVESIPGRGTTFTVELPAAPHA